MCRQDGDQVGEGNRLLEEMISRNGNHSTSALTDVLGTFKTPHTQGAKVHIPDKKSVLKWFRKEQHLIAFSCYRLYY